jgi:hypothetical protein
MMGGVVRDENSTLAAQQLLGAGPQIRQLRQEINLLDSVATGGTLKLRLEL